MTQTTTGLRSILGHPRVYTLFQRLMGAHSGWQRLVGQYVKAKEGDALLDVGCGPGDLLGYLPAVRYWGFDISEAYIEQARRTHGGRGEFRCKLLTMDDLRELPAFDVVVASGVLHHMDDGVAEEFLQIAHAALRTNGRLVTVDPCLVPGQNPVARFLIERDRGQNVRDERGYGDLARTVFETVATQTRHKAWVPYTHCYMECTKK
jgi:SAM-dependent methyltransferase